MLRLLGVAVVVASLACGCGDDAPPSGPVDGGTSLADGAVSGGDAAGIAAPPVIPWAAAGAPPVALPVLGPCPMGWRAVTDGDLASCDPYPAAGAMDCGPGQAHFPGEPGCANAGAACPVGDFADGLADDGSVVFVRAGATGGDGTRALPFGTFTEVGVPTLAAGRTLAIAKGTYVGTLAIGSGVRVVGACAAETILTGAAGVTPVVSVSRSGTAAELRDVTISAAAQAGISVVGPGRVLVAHGVIIDHVVANAAILLDTAGSLQANGLVVRGTRASDGMFGRGLNVEDGAHAELTRAVLDDNANVGIFAGASGTSVVLTDVAILDTQTSGTGRFGTGIDVEVGASVDATRVVLDGNHRVGIQALTGSSVTLTDAIVRNTLPESSGAFGRGIDAESGSHVELTRGVVAGNSSVGLFVGAPGTTGMFDDVIVRDNAAVGVSFELGGTGEGARLAIVDNAETGLYVSRTGSAATFTDVLVRGTTESARPQSGRAIVVQEGATVSLDRAILERNAAHGIFAGGDGARVQVTDLLIRDTSGRMSDGLLGRGIEVLDGAQVEVERAVLARNRFTAVFGSGPGATITLTDVIVEDTMSHLADSMGGRGISLQLGSSLTATRVLIDRSREIALFAASPDTTATLTDVTIRATDANEADLHGGAGLQGQDGAVVTGTRVRVENNLGLAVSSVDGSTVTLVDAEIVGVRSWRCAETTCPATPYGYGASAVSGVLSLRRFRVADCAICGVFVHGTGALDLADGSVSGSAIGACVQPPGYDFARLMPGVSYTDNGRNLDSTMLPVPTALTTL